MLWMRKNGDTKEVEMVVVMETKEVMDMIDQRLKAIGFEPEDKETQDAVRFLYRAERWWSKITTTLITGFVLAIIVLLAKFSVFLEI